MSSSDVSRYLDQPGKQYVGARLEQGRPLLDADFNEESRLREREQQVSVQDWVGPAGSPNDGFSPGRALPLIGSTNVSTAALLEGSTLPVQRLRISGTERLVHAVSIRPGSIYLAGIRFALDRTEHIALQRGYLQMRPEELPVLGAIRSPSPIRSPSRSPSPWPGPGHYPPFANFYYLRAWEQEVSAVEDEEIREVALAGADTSTRLRRMHRVEVSGNLPPHIADCQSAFDLVVRRMADRGLDYDPATHRLNSRARLQLTFQEEDSGECPECEVSPTARYLGHENATLRIMLTSPTSYVWATDNGAPLYRVKVTGLSSPRRGKVTVKMLTLPKDLEHHIKSGRVVEILPFGAVLDTAEDLARQDPHFQKVADRVGAFARARTNYNPASQTFELELGDGTQEMAGFVTQWDYRHPAANQLNFSDPEGSDGRFFYMRVWHQAEQSWDVHRSTKAKAPLGDTGIVPLFHQTGQKGDYWVASFRVDRPDRCVPFDLLTQSGGVPPHGPIDYLTPLFLITGEDQLVETVHDCRTRIRKANDQSCATRSVGDGVTSFGEYSSIQAAIDALPAAGGVVEVRPGVHRGPIRVVGRSNVTLVGCGQSVIQSTPGNEDPALITVQDSDGFSLSGFALQAEGHPALVISGGEGFRLGEAIVSAGRFVDGVFQVGDGTSSVELMRLDGARAFKMQGFEMYPGRQPALRLDNCLQGTVTGFVATSEAMASAPPAGPVLRISGCDTLRVSEGRVLAAGQQAVRIEQGRSITLRNLVLESDEQRVVDDGAVTPAQSALYTIDTQRLDVQQCRISMAATPSEHAAVSLHGNDLTVEEGFIEAAPDGSGFYQVWGGIHVRGGSSRIVLRHNHVTGGYGHGVTLGSVHFGDGQEYGPGHLLVDWGETSPGTPALPPRVHGNLANQSPEAHSEAPLDGITITGNTIENMGTNGISALTVLGLRHFEDFITVRRIVVTGNYIRGNVRQPYVGMAHDVSFLPVGSNQKSMSELAVSMLPRGGIVLAVVEGAGDFRGNEITGNTPPLSFDTGGAWIPLCGLFVLIGDSLQIVDNRIAGNGEVVPTSTGIPSGIERGVRAGVAVLLAGTATEDTPRDPVRSPGDVDRLFTSASDLNATGRALLVTRNSVRQPEGRALMVIGTGDIAIESNFFSSQGYLKGTSSEERGKIGDVIFLMDLGRPWESQRDESGALHFGPVVPGEAGNHFVEYITSPTIPRQFLGFGGAVSFCNNQVTYDFKPPRNDSPTAPLSHFASAIVSLDHASVSSNQFALQLEDPHWTYGRGSPRIPTPLQEPLLGDVFVFAATLDVAQNRIAERVGDTFLSLAAFAELSGIVSYNQCTHELVAHRTGRGPADADIPPRPLLLKLSNHVMYVTPNAVTYRESQTLKNLIENFGRVLRKGT